MKLAITIKKPCHPKCLYELTGDVYTTTKTYLIELYNLPKEVVDAINEVENEGCVSSISFQVERDGHQGFGNFEADPGKARFRT